MLFYFILQDKSESDILISNKRSKYEETYGIKRRYNLAKWGMGMDEEALEKLIETCQNYGIHIEQSKNVLKGTMIYKGKEKVLYVNNPSKEVINIWISKLKNTYFK